MIYLRVPFTVNPYHIYNMILQDLKQKLWGKSLHNIVLFFFYPSFIFQRWFIISHLEKIVGVIPIEDHFVGSKFIPQQWNLANIVLDLSHVSCTYTVCWSIFLSLYEIDWGIYRSIRSSRPVKTPGLPGRTQGRLGRRSEWQAASAQVTPEGLRPWILGRSPSRMRILQCWGQFPVALYYRPIGCDVLNIRFLIYCNGHIMKFL